MVDEPIFKKLQQFHADLGRAPGQGGAELRYFGREVAMDADVLLDVRIGRMGKELFFGAEMGHRVVVQDIQNFQKSLIGAALTHGPVEIVESQPPA